MSYFYIKVYSGLNNKLIPLLSLLRIAKKENKIIKCYWGNDAYINKNMFALQGRAFGKEKPKYITINLDEKKDNIYGLHRLQKDKLTYVVEGPIDSLFLDNCIAVAGADFKKLDKENKVIIFDNERRSVEILKRIREIIDLDYKVVLWPDDIKEKDINDMILSGKSKHEIMNIISKNTFSGNMARMKFAIWRKRNA